MRPARAALPSLTMLLGMLLVVVACGGAPGPTSSPAGGSPSPAASPPGTSGSTELRVYAAASLKNALAELVAAYETGHPGSRVIVSTDSSAALAARIEEGAPADVFLAADTATPQRLVDAGLADGDLRVFAGNELAVIVPPSNPGGLASPADLADPGLKVIATGDEVPITGYSRRLLAQLAGLDGYPDDFAARVEANVVSREDNVGGIVAKVALGEGDAGIVYATDARAADVAVVPIPAGHNVAASYAAIALRDARDAGAASEFLAWLTTAEAQDILASFGFRPVA